MINVLVITKGFCFHLPACAGSLRAPPLQPRRDKLFSYMAAGLPVIATNLPEIKPIVDQTMCGILVEPGNIDEIVRAAVWLSEHPEEALEMGRNGQMAISSTFNWRVIEDRLIGVYRALTPDFVE